MRFLLLRHQLRRLQKDGTARRTLTLRAPMDATVTEKTAVQGMRFAAGDPLYRLVDLSSVWIVADVFEQDLASVREGEEASVTVAAYPGATFTGKVGFVYPSVTPETRTAKVRIEVANGDGRLKTGMYATVGLKGPVGSGPVLACPIRPCSTAAPARWCWSTTARAVSSRARSRSAPPSTATRRSRAG
jgi:Cu(I)/Ag(I) efflux system membrane fusion protein